MTGAPILFLSDAHLRGRFDPDQAVVARFLEAHAGADATLVILGDLFDYLAGTNRTAVQEYAPVLAALGRFRSCHYLEGNHDFDLPPQIAGLSAASIWPAGVTLELAGFTVRLFHGDRTSRADWGTRALRRVVQSAAVRWIRDRALPDPWAHRFGLAFASFSRRSTWPGRAHEAEEIRARAHREAHEARADLVVFGHTHLPLLESDKDLVLANPGSARTGGSYLSLEGEHLWMRSFPGGEPLPPSPLRLRRRSPLHQ